MDSFPVCTHCGFTFGEYRARGLLGCPHCYAGFGDALQADVAWLHRAMAFAEAEPPAPPALDAQSLARWREQITEAVRTENYEEAARLNRLIRGIGPSENAAGQRPGLGLV